MCAHVRIRKCIDRQTQHSKHHVAPAGCSYRRCGFRINGEFLSNELAISVLFHQYTMTLLVQFLCSTQTRPIVKFNICSSNFDDKILYDIPDGDKQFIEKVWLDLEEGDATISSKSSSKRFGMLRWNMVRFQKRWRRC